jgi:hypothetical protein
MADKTYIGKGKAIGQYGNVAINICLSDIPSHAVSEFKGKQYVKLVISQMRSQDEKGRTHTVWVDDWQPDPNRKQSAPQETTQQPTTDANQDDDQINPEDIPF